MDSDKSIYELEGEIKKLEFEKMNEQYHLDSIPQRKKMTKSKARIKLLFIIIVTALIIILAVGINKGIKGGAGAILESYGFAIMLVSNSIAIIALAIFDFFLIRGWLEQMSFLHGSKNKKINFGARNYNDERVKSEDKIGIIEDEIKELRRIISEKKSGGIEKKSVYNKQQVNLSGNMVNWSQLNNDEMFAYIYGQWGEEKEVVEKKIANGEYEKEKSSLVKKINEQNSILDYLERRKNKIDSDYQLFINKIYIFVGIIIVLAIASLLGRDYKNIVIWVAIVGIFIFIAAIMFFISQWEATLIPYLVEYKYDFVCTYAEEHGMKPTYELKKTAIQKKKDFENRLDFIDFIMNAIVI